MDDTEEVDILGDFDYKSSSTLIDPEDDKELPSKSVQLLPEFSQHPWLLEQGWTLDNCTDEKSRAVIEKMLIEEQSYTEGKAPRSGITIPQPTYTDCQVQRPPSQVPSGSTTKRKSSWTEEERSLFYQGLEIYGRRWSKIAELIPSKTRQQIKNFALHHLKNKLKGPNKSIDDRSTVKFVSATVTSQSDPDNNCTSSEHESNHRLSASPSKIKKKMAQNTNKVTGNRIVVPEAQIVRIKRFSGSESEEDIDIDIEIDSEDGNASSAVNVTSESEENHIIDESIKSEKDPTGLPAIDVDSHPGDAVFAIPGTQNVKLILSDQDDSVAPRKDLICDYLVHEPNIASSGPDEESNSGQKLTCNERDTREALEKVASLENVVGNNIQETETPETPCNNSDDSFSNDEEDHQNEFGLVTSEGTIIYLPNPSCAVSIDREDITPMEKEIHKEFFDGRPGVKTALRYTRIRNHILECWEKCKPNFLKKTAVRVGLRNCGDVNCIGRIHSFLEQIGAINFGCEQAQYNHPSTRPQPRIHKEIPNKEELLAARNERMRPRKRRVRDAFGEWINERDLEGKTIEHGLEEDIIHYSVKMKPKSVAGKKNVYDPFKLIPCLQYGEDNKAPFSLNITSSALVIMDTHAHLSKTEVIGLLGGHYDKEQQCLSIMTAEPCESLSTGMQCEMDPVSQTQACERLSAQGQKVVGWYHSHPVFEAKPSLRDIETQLDFQEWFSADGNAFVGIIVSPYDRNTLSMESTICCLSVEKESSNSNHTHEKEGQPFQFDYNVSHEHGPLNNLFDAIIDLASKYVGYANRVHMLQPYQSKGNLICLEKMLHSLKGHLTKTCTTNITMDNHRLVENIRLKFNELYSNDVKKQ